MTDHDTTFARKRKTPSSAVKTRKRSASKVKSVAIERPSRDMQEDLLTLLYYNEQEGRSLANTLANTVKPRHVFEGDYLDFAERAVQYWSEYKRPPGLHGIDLFDDVFKDPKNRKAQTYRTILGLMNEKHHDDPSFNAQYVLDQLSRASALTQARHKLIEMGERLRPGDLQGLRERTEELLEIVHSVAVNKQPMLVPADEFKAQKVGWYRRPFFPRNMLSILASVKGLGKTTVLIDSAADLSTRDKPRYTIFLTKEDAPGLFLKPLMTAAKGDPTKLLFYGSRDSDGTVNHQPPDRLDCKGLAWLESQIDDLKGQGRKVGLIAIEPLNSFVDAAVTNSDAGIRTLLDNLALLAARHRLMVIASTHWNKNEELRTRDRIIGSVGIVNTARSVNVLIKDPDQPQRRLLINLVGNLVSGEEENAIGFTIKSTRGLHRIEWEDKDEMFRLDEDEVDDMVVRRKEPRRRGRPNKVERASELLGEWLKDGPVRVTELKTLAKDANISWRILNNAKKDANFCIVASFKKGGVWYWKI